MKAQLRKWCFFMVILTLLISSLHITIAERTKASRLKEHIWESADFRNQELTGELYEELRERTSGTREFARILTITMLNGDFWPKKLSVDGEAYLKYKKEQFYQLWNYYEMIWADSVCFPVAAEGVSFENGYGVPRNYGGKRIHEGIDLFGKRNEPGYYPILSMSDGTVEKIGWLPLGGYRIGIRGERGAYYYYAHLSGYEREFSPGDTVEAGEILGYMGNSGYGPEGTMGKFPVHLHLGIYISTESIPELSINPYRILQVLQKKNVKYTY